MESHKTGRAATLKETRVLNVVNWWPWKLELDRKLKNEVIDTPEFIENYSHQIYFNSKNKKNFKWAVKLLLSTIPIFWSVIIFFILGLANYFDISEFWVVPIGAIILIFASLFFPLSIFSRVTYREYLKAQANIWFGYKNSWWRASIRFNYKLKHYTFSDVNLNSDSMKLEDENVIHSWMIWFRIYFLSILNLLSSIIVLVIGIVSIIMWAAF